MLPSEFLDRPIAHRALHDIELGRPENSLGAIRAAVDAGYGIEIDIQQSSDGCAMVFHDDVLDRLTNAVGPIQSHSRKALEDMTLRGSEGTIPTLKRVLDCVAGRVPLLVEIKDQDGALGSDIGSLEAAVANDISGYEGSLAVMSFNPHSVGRMAELCPDVPRGLTTCEFDPSDWPVPQARCDALREIPDFDRVGASFISHDWRDLSCAPVRHLKGRGVPVLCWTIRSDKEAQEALKIADNVTFEAYLP